MSNKQVVCAILLWSLLGVTRIWAFIPFWGQNNGYPIFSSQHYTPVITLALGGASQNGGETQVINLQSEIVKKYVTNTESKMLGTVDLLLGLERRFNEHYSALLGLSFVATGPAKLSGQIWDDADEDFNNFVYQYQIQHKHLALKAKLMRDMGYLGLKPYLSASFGVGINEASNFAAIAIIEEAVGFPDFTPNKTRSYTYTLGFGLQKSLNKYWQLGLGYEFADWGKSQLGAAPEQLSGMGLKLDHLYTHGIFLSLTWLLKGDG